VSADTAGLVQSAGAGTRVHRNGLLDDEAILGEFADGLAGVGGGNFGNFVGVEPDLALSAVEDGRREALLGSKVDPIEDDRLA